MSWNQFEYSTNDGRPVTLYEFIHSGQKFYRYTNADRNIEFNHNSFMTTAISNNGLSMGTGNSLEITLPANTEVTKLYRGIPPSTALLIRIYQLHAHDGEIDFRVVWIGKIQEVKREALDRAKFITASVASSFERNGLRLTYGRSCPHALYDHNCQVQKEQFALCDIEIIKLDGANIIVSLPNHIKDGYFSGGYIAWFIDGIKEMRGLKTQLNGKMGLLGGTHDLKTGMKITVYPGCDRTIKTCSEKFGNHLNYGGQPHIPGVSPFQIIKLF
ncbi:phage BR0599 family protein [Orbaceae bacterium ESL0721]|nr:phage BR0599 family protein [Orbaceae bacterium ESL0721]